MKYIIGAGAAVAITGFVLAAVLVDALLDYSEGVYDWAEVSNGRPLRPTAPYDKWADFDAWLES